MTLAGPIRTVVRFPSTFPIGVVFASLVKGEPYSVASMGTKAGHILAMSLYDEDAPTLFASEFNMIITSPAIHTAKNTLSSCIPMIMTWRCSERMTTIPAYARRATESRVLLPRTPLQFYGISKSLASKGAEFRSGLLVCPNLKGLLALLTNDSRLYFASLQSTSLGENCVREHIVCLSFPGSVFALRDMQEVHPLAPHQFGPSDSPVRVNQHLMLAAPRQQPARNTPGERRERDLIQGQQTVGAGIVADAGAGAELRTTRGFRRREQLLALRLAAAVDLAPFCQPIAFLRPDRLDGLHRLRTGTDRQLREQAEAQAGLTIHAVMGSVGVGDALVPADGPNPGGGFIKATLRLSQDGLVSRGIQLNADGSREHFVHKNIVTDVLIIVKGCAHASVLSSPRLKAGEYPERSFL